MSLDRATNCLEIGENFPVTIKSVTNNVSLSWFVILVVDFERANTLISAKDERIR